MEPRRIDLPDATVLVYPDAVAAGQEAAERIIDVIRDATEARGKAVLGMATGGTPLPIYAELANACRLGRVSFANAVTYNLDEYYPMSPRDPRSYRTYMHRHLFTQVEDLPANRAHLLDGSVPEAFANEHGAQYDRWIEADGGLDMQLLGIGRNGHIGFNEPAPELSVEEFRALPTRVVELHPVTRSDAVKDFGGDAEQVPARALTVGVKPILAARSVIMVAHGAKKATILAKALLEPITPKVPASMLRLVPDRVIWLLDEAAAADLPS